MPMNSDKCSRVEEIRQGVVSALSELGLTPYFLDRDAHGDNIYNIMLENIKNCKFLVADLTSQNAGVYYEAGYAKALGKRVILTCHDEDFDNRHFDVAQVQTLKWTTESDLANKLSDHIKKAGLCG